MEKDQALEQPEKKEGDNELTIGDVTYRTRTRMRWKPGTVITQDSGSKYQVMPNGSWRKLK